MHSIISNYYYFAMVVMVIITIVVATVVIAIDVVFASQFSPQPSGPPGHVRRCRRVDVDRPQVLITWRPRANEKVVMQRGKGLERSQKIHHIGIHLGIIM